MALVTEFHAGELKDAFVRISGVLDEHAQALDTLSGIESGGVGTVLTEALASAVESAATASDLVSIASAMANGARTASGSVPGQVLLELFASFAEVASGADSIDAGRFALVLELAAERLRERDGSVDPGGPTAVVSAASEGALRASDQGLGLPDVIIAAADEGLDELESGVVANPRLAEVGVVDATAAGFLLVLDSLAAIVTGDQLPQAPVEVLVGADDESPIFLVVCTAIPLESAGTSDGSWIESCAWIESTWNDLGSLDVFEILGDRCRLELRTRDAGRAIEALCEVGRPTELRIELQGARAEPATVGAQSDS
ncbi:MAG: hypothetical protein R2735_01815 [Microthrixaceae bacterium]